MRRAFFWVAVGGTAILANFAVELAAAKAPWPAVQQFAAFIHRGGQ